MNALHVFFSAVIGGPDSDLAWAAVRALTAIASLITAWAVRFSVDRFLAWVTVGLGTWVLLKVADDIHASLMHMPGPNLTVYFLGSNALWFVILVGFARMAQREQKAILKARHSAAGVTGD